MKSSRKKNMRGRFFDVVASEEKFLKRQYLKLASYGHTVNLRPTILRQYQNLSIFLLLVLIVFFWFRPSLFLKAESADFYPTNCLGTWHNPQAAQGQPRFLLSSEGKISEQNSAIFSGDTNQIFCGAFVPPTFASSGKITHVGLTLIWQVGDEPAQGLEDGVFQPIPTETEASSSSEATTTEPTTSVDLGSQDIDEAKEEVKEEATNEGLKEGEELSEPTSFLRSIFFPLVLAQEEATPPSPVENPAPVVSESTPPVIISPEPAPTVVEEVAEPEPTPEPVSEEAPELPTPTEENEPENTESSTVIILGPPIRAVLDELVVESSSLETEGITSTTETSSYREVPPPPFVPDETFLLVKYSLDGQNWINLKRVGERNWQNLTLNLPISSWEDLSKVQIAIEGTPTTLPEPLPTVLLSGMLVEVHYEKSILEEDTESAKKVISSSYPPAADPVRLESTRQSLAARTGKNIVLSQQFESNPWIAFKVSGRDEQDIFIFNIESGDMKNITNTSGQESEPVIQGSLVAWVYAGNEPGEELGEIYLYDIDNEEVLRITNDNFADQPPYFQDDVLVWEKTDVQGRQHIFQYDLSTATTTQVGSGIFNTEPEPASPESEVSE